MDKYEVILKLCTTYACVMKLFQRPWGSSPELEELKIAAKSSIMLRTREIELVDIKPTDLFSNFKKINKHTIRQSNWYYACYGVEYIVETWRGWEILS